MQRYFFYSIKKHNLNTYSFFLFHLQQKKIRMTYARVRLYLGLCNTLLFVLLSMVLLLPHTSEFLRELKLSDGCLLVYYILFYLLISLPFDIYGGLVIPKKYAKHQINYAVYFLKWLRTSIIQSSFMWGLGMTFIFLSTFNVLLISSLVLITAFILLEYQGFFTALISGFKITKDSSLEPHLKLYGLKNYPIYLAENNDLSFAGGWCGLLGKKKLIIPKFWKEQLSEIGLMVQIARRVGALETNTRVRGILVALICLLLNTFIGLWFIDFKFDDAVSVVQFSAVNTVLCFINLLILPFLSRPAVIESDLFALEQGFDYEDIKETIEFLDVVQDDELCRSTFVEMFFHPTPCATSRLWYLHLKKPIKQKGGWQTVSNLLYLSSINLSLLPKATNANVGRIDLYVMHPSD